MIDINNENRANCSGCTACAERCPVNCITMKRDKMGFLYPDIDVVRCVNCGLCERVCPGEREQHTDVIPQMEVYAAKGLDEKIRSVSSSGGVFSLMAQYIISQGGVVFGAAFDNGYRKVRHVAVESMDHLSRIQGSKYVQSDMNLVFKEVKMALEQGKMVMFSGTPCQIAGLKAYLEKDYSQLILVSIVCHGVPAPEVWEEYIDYLEKKHHGKAMKISFRDKRRGWRNYVISIKFDNGMEYINNRSDDLYMRGFLHNCYLRPSCFQCKFKGISHGADIILGDLWGAEKLSSDLDDDKGTSLVIISSHKGKELFNEVTNLLRYNTVDIELVILKNQSIVKSAEYIAYHKQFENEFQNKPIDVLLRKYCSESMFNRIKKRIKCIVGTH